MARPENILEVVECQRCKRKKYEPYTTYLFNCQDHLSCETCVKKHKCVDLYSEKIVLKPNSVIFLSSVLRQLRSVQSVKREGSLGSFTTCPEDKSSKPSPKKRKSSNTEEHEANKCRIISPDSKVIIRQTNNEDIISRYTERTNNMPILERQDTSSKHPIKRCTIPVLEKISSLEKTIGAKIDLPSNSEKQQEPCFPGFQNDYNFSRVLPYLSMIINNESEELVIRRAKPEEVDGPNKTVLVKGKQLVMEIRKVDETPAAIEELSSPERTERSIQEEIREQLNDSLPTPVTSDNELPTSEKDMEDRTNVLQDVVFTEERLVSQERENGKNPTFTALGLSHHDHWLAVALAKKLKYSMSLVFKNDTTHVILGDEINESNKDCLLLAIVYRVPIVTFDWVTACLKEKSNKLLPPEGYISKIWEGPARCLVTNDLPFDKICIFVRLMQPNTPTEYKESEFIKTLCNLGGAKIIRDIEAFLSEDSNSSLFPRFYVCESAILSRSAAEKCEALRAVPVLRSWVRDSIAAYKLLPINKYLYSPFDKDELLHNYLVPQYLLDNCG